MKAGLPIVFIHQGHSDYLPYAFVQVTQTNPDSEIYLLGDEANKTFGSILNHRLAKQYFKRAGQFAPLYKHHSTNPYDYELFCIQRWFVLLEFMEVHNLERCLYLDSDILYFSNATVEQPFTATHGLTSVTKSPHTCYVNSRAALEAFCQYITSCYGTTQGYDQLMGYLAEHEAIHGKLGGISDMSFFLHYRREHPDRVLDLSQVFEAEQPFTYDITIDTANGFTTAPGGFKEIKMVSGQPYGTLNGQAIRFVTLHFQGGSKSRMSEFVTAKPTNYERLLAQWARERLMQKVIGKLKKMVRFK